MSAQRLDLAGAWREILPSVLTVAGGVIVWKAISLLFLPVFLPGPGVLAERMAQIYGNPSSYAAVGQTLASIFEGFAASMIIGTAAGLAMGLRRGIATFFDSWIMVLLTFPAVCWAFLSVLWFGLSSAASVMTIVLISTPFVIMNIWTGTKAVEPALTEMARVYRAHRTLMLRKVLIPQLMPYVFASLRIALSLAWKMALVAEAFGGGGGVGQQLMYWFQGTRVDMMLAWGVSFMIVMVVIDLVVFRLWARRAFAWRRPIAT